MPTIRQLAKLAGVSPATVSLALRNRPGVSAATRQRICALAATYHYRVSLPRHARHSMCSGTLGYLAPAFETQFLTQVLAGILSLAFTESYRVIPLPVNTDDARALCLAIEALIEQGIDGLLIYGAQKEVPADLLFHVASRGIPIVFLNDNVPTVVAHDHVIIDDAQIAHLSVGYLYQLGHRQIAYIGLCDPPSRADALKICAKKYGMTMQCLLMAHITELEQTLDKTYRTRPLPTAFVCLNDYWAVGAIHFLHQQGRRVPDEVSVLGFGNFVLSQYSEPSITTIIGYPMELGRRALVLLIERIREGQESFCLEPKIERVIPELLVRESCASPHPQHTTFPTDSAGIRITAKSPLTAQSHRPRAVAVCWCVEDSIESLHQRLQAETSPEVRPRWEALWLLRQGLTVAEAARAVNRHRRTLYDWIAWYNQGGIEALAKHPPGRPRGE